MTFRTETLMGGMPFTLEAMGAVPQDLFDAVFAELRWVDRTFSPFRADSEVSLLNRGVLQEKDAHPLVREVLARCRSYAVETDGYFDAWCDGGLDPCGLVKGWAIGRARDLLEGAGLRSFYVDGAGDVLVRGTRDGGHPWRVGIRHPVQRDRVVHVVAASDLAVATSGTYERGAHIIDPHTGRRASELISLTVVGPDIVAADVYATAAFAMGREGLGFIDTIPGYEALAIDADLFEASTPGFGAMLVA